MEIPKETGRNTFEEIGRLTSPTAKARPVRAGLPTYMAPAATRV